MSSLAKTWEQLLQQRGQYLFIGRTREEELFRLNFMYKVPQHLIFHVQGQAGSGKSTLIARYIATAKEHNALIAKTQRTQTAAIKEQCILQTMLHIARQFSAAGTPLTAFEERYTEYNNSLQTILNDTTAPAGMFDLLESPEKTKDQPSAAWIRYLEEKIGVPQKIAMIKNPIETLSHFFFKDINAWATIRPTLLFFDDWELLEAHLEEWLIKILMQGNLNTNIWLVLASENPLSSNWQDLRPLTMTLNLLPFSDEETLNYLQAKGITDSARTHDIITFSNGLPILVNLLSSVTGGYAGDLALTPLDRYIKWLDNPNYRDMILQGAATRRIDLEVVRAITETEDAEVRFEWLKNNPLLVKENEAWVYHPALRHRVLNHAQQLAPRAINMTHERLERYYQQQLHDYDAPEEPCRDNKWRKLKLETLYHGLMAGYITAEQDSIALFLKALRNYYPLAGEVLRTWKEVARAQIAKNSVTQWAKILDAGWAAIEKQSWEGTLTFCMVLAEREDLSPDTQTDIHSIRILAEARLGILEAPIETAATEVADETSETAEAEVTEESAAPQLTGETAEAQEMPVATANPDKRSPADAAEAPENKTAPVTTEAQAAPEEAPAPSSAPETQPKTLAAEPAEPPTPPEKRSAEPQEQPESEPECAPEPELEQEPVTAAAPHTQIEPEPQADHPKETESETAATERPSDKTETKTAEDYNGRANVYLNMHEYKKAITEYNKAIALNPEYILAYFNRGIAYTQLKSYRHAIEDFSQVIKLNPQYTSAYKNRGLLYTRQKNWELAINDYTQAIQLNDQDAAAYNSRGNVYYNLSDHQHAITDYDQAIKHNPNYTTAYLNRGLAYIGMGEYQKAIADYNQAIALNPQDACSYNYRGQAYAHLQQYKRALQDYTQALEQNPQLISTHNNIGLTHTQLGKYKQAIGAYRKAITLNPKFATGHYNAACAAALMGDIYEACTWLESAIALQPNYRMMAEQDSDFDTIRGTREFRAMLKAK